MDSLSSWAVLLSIVALIIAAIAIRRRQFRALLGEVAGLPSRVTNPRLYAKLRTIRAWELKSAEGARACTWARESNGLRFRTEQAARLPIAGCGRKCQCEYLPVIEGRRRQRRALANAETVLNMGDGKASNRRHKDGRRKGDHWSGDQR
jgi:hypothetical protein